MVKSWKGKEGRGFGDGGVYGGSIGVVRVGLGVGVSLDWGE